MNAFRFCVSSLNAEVRSTRTHSSCLSTKLLSPDFPLPSCVALYCMPYARSNIYAPKVAKPSRGGSLDGASWRTGVTHNAAPDAAQPLRKEVTLQSATEYRSDHAFSMLTAQALSSAVPDCGSTALIVRPLVGT